MDNKEHDIETTGAELRELVRWNVVQELAEQTEIPSFVEEGSN